MHRRKSKQTGAGEEVEVQCRLQSFLEPWAVMAGQGFGTRSLHHPPSALGSACPGKEALIAEIKAKAKPKGAGSWEWPADYTPSVDLHGDPLDYCGGYCRV